MTIAVRTVINDWLSSGLIDNLSTVTLATSTQTAEAATTSGTFLGDNTASAGAQGEEIFSDPKNLPTAIATIMGHTQTKANFHPAAQTPEEVAKSYPTYLVGMDNTPFFHLSTNDYVKKKYATQDYNTLIDDVLSLYDGMSDKDLEKLKTGITDMGRSVFGQSSAEEWRNLFSQATIVYSDADAPMIYIYYTTLYMHHKDGKSEVNEQEFTVNRAEYQVLPSLIQAYASSLAHLVKVDVDDWINDSTSPSTTRQKLCFEKG